MPTRGDQLQSHQFTMQRMVGALAMRDPDPVTSPIRRIAGALLASVLVAVLMLAAVAVYGVIRPGPSDAWRSGPAVVIEVDTGARFVYRDGVLHPALNYTSALLAVGSAEPVRVRVPGASLKGVPRGTPMGIPGAPDHLPPAADLATTGWTVCSRPPTSGGTAADSVVETVLLVGAAPGDGTPEATMDALGGQGLVARDPSGGLHLLWRDRRYAIVNPDLVFAAMAWPRQATVPVTSAVLNAVPAGMDLGRLRVDRVDRPSPVAGFRVGEVFVVANQSGGQQFGVVQATGLADITSVQAGLLVADNANGLGGKPTQMGQAQYAAAPRAASLVPMGDGAPPAMAPQPVQPTSSMGVCVSFADGDTTGSVVLSTPPVRRSDERQLARVQGAQAATAASADWVVVPPGRAAVVEALAGPSSPSGALAIVSDLGVRYPIASRDVLGILGYSQVTPLRLPAALVALLPSGRALDPAAAMAPVVVTSVGASRAAVLGPPPRRLPEAG